MAQHKIQRYEQQKRRLWNGDHPTQFGYRYKKLIAERDRYTAETMSQLHQRYMSLDIESALAGNDPA